VTGGVVPLAQAVAEHIAARATDAYVMHKLSQPKEPPKK
jgi:hypothetical protein